MLIEVSNGEILDKLAIVEIKLKYIKDASKRENLMREHAVLENAAKTILSKESQLYQQLFAVNEKLWHIEEACRAHEAQQRFDQTFIELARSVYITNDERAHIKKLINESTGSNLVEEKSYQ